MLTVLNKYRALALAIGFGGLFAYGADSPDPNTNQANDSMNNSEVYSLTKEVQTNYTPVSEEIQQPTGLDTDDVTKTRFIPSNHKAITRKALTGRLNDLTVQALVQNSTIGDDDPVENCYSRTHFDNCYYEDGVAWVRSNREKAVAAAKRYYSTHAEQDRQEVFRHLGFVIHATEDFYSHSNWVEEHPAHTICDFNYPKPSGWYSGRWIGNWNDPSQGCLCEEGSPWHTVIGGFGMNKDSSDRDGYPGSYQEAYDDAVLAVRDQIQQFKNVVDNKVLKELGFLQDSQDLPDLHLGSIGKYVVRLQVMLNVLGFYYDDIEGSFGNNTDAALRNFQRSNGLAVDGSCGPNTWRTLYSSLQLDNFPDLSKQDYSHSYYVKLLQSLLKSLGFYYDDIDGSFGNNTDAALRNFQRSHGLAVDGSCGPNTWNALFNN